MSNYELFRSDVITMNKTIALMVFLSGAVFFTLALTIGWNDYLIYWGPIGGQDDPMPDYLYGLQYGDLGIALLFSGVAWNNHRKTYSR